MPEHTTFVDDPETVDDIVHEDEATDPEPLERGELVVREPEHVTAIERAAEMAMENPGIPGRDEFLSLAAQARVLSMSAAAPKQVRDNPHLAFHVAMVGRDLNISPSAALELIDVIDGRDGPQLSLSPQLLNGQIRRLGLGSVVPAVRTNHRAVAVVLGPEGRLDPRCKRTWPDHWTSPTDPTVGCGCADVLGDYEFTWEDAQMAGLASFDCQPGEHTEECQKWVRGHSCNSGYKSYPKRMLWWRASGFAVDDYFPEAGLGLYTAEELGAVVDEHGRPVDPATAELPPGFDPGEAEREAAEQRAREEAPADPEQLEQLRERIAVIKRSPKAAEALTAIWTAPVGERQTPRLPPLPKLRNCDLPKAETAVASVEAQAEKGKFGDWPPAEEPDAEPEAKADAEAEPVESTGDAIADEVIAEVRAMDIVDVRAELDRRDLPNTGNDQRRRQVLAQALYEARVMAPEGDEAAHTSPGDESEGDPAPEDTETTTGHTEADPVQPRLGDDE